MPHPHTFSGIAMVIWIVWVLPGGARVETAEAGNVVTTAQALARVGARALPSEPKLSVNRPDIGELELYLL
jgi:hypothetical protein